MTRPKDLIWIPLLAGAVIGGCQSDETPSGLIDGFEFYRQNRVSEAWPNFARAVVQQPKNPDAHAWVAEADRRLKRPEDAIASARAALAIDPCHSFAHTVLGDTYTPELPFSIPNADSAWAHYRAAAECDPEDGNARIGLWREALRRDERSVEDDALRVLITSGFLPPSVLAFNRWTLRSLPEDAVLITNGDWDTFPALALQVAEEMRTDVVVANVNLLNLDWYTQRLHERFGLQLPPENGADSAAQPSERILQYWTAASLAGSLGRPLVFALTTDPSRLTAPAALQEAGSYRRVVARDEPVADTASMRASLDGVTGADFAGPETSPADRSAVRLAANHAFPVYVFYAGLQYAEALADAGRNNEARDVLQRFIAFGEDAAIAKQNLDFARDVRNGIAPLN